MKNDHRSIVRRNPAPQSVTRSVVGPLYPSVVYAAQDADELDACYAREASGYTYAREGHPNASVLADKIAWLEGAEMGVITASGMAAASALLLGKLRKGDHLVAGSQLYGRTQRILREDLPRLGFDVDLVDTSRVENVQRALKSNTRMILLEVISNPTLRVAEVDRIGDLANDQGITFAVDNTFTTPLSFKPLEWKADIVVHSVTKLMAGHSDVTLGALCGNAAQLESISEAVATWGLNASPFDCWLAERGINTLELRLTRAQDNARALAEFLGTLPGIKTVIYPGLPSHPDHALAQRLLGENFGNMLSFELEGARPEVNRFIRALRHVPFAPTLGDVSTTISHPCSSSHRGLSPEQRQELGIAEGLIRVSVGIEEADQLKREFGEALHSTFSDPRQVQD